MAHPHKHRAAEASREKFQAITGHKGGGHAHAGASHLKKPNEHGVQKVWSGHHKTHLHADERAHGGRSKSRGDNKYARGGKVDGKSPKEVNVTIQMTPPSGTPGGAAPPPPPPPPVPPGGAGGAPPPGGPPPGGGAPGGGANPMAALGKGLGFARGGHVTKIDKSTTLNNSHDLAHWKKYADKGTSKKAEMRASGGRMTAGALSGEGRLQKASIAKRSGRGR